jgi:hypothetical protein
MLRVFMAKVRQLKFNQYIENISRVEFSIDLSEITQKIVLINISISKFIVTVGDAPRGRGRGQLLAPEHQRITAFFQPGPRQAIPLLVRTGQ